MLPLIIILSPAPSTDRYSFKFATYTQKRGASPVPGPRFEGSRIALISQTEQRRKPHADVFIDAIPYT